MLPGYPVPKFFLNMDAVPLTEDERYRPEPSSADGKKELADEHLTKGRIHQSITCYKKAARLENTPERRTDLGDAYAFAELPVNALKQYRKALKNNAKSPVAHFGLAELYTRYGRWHAAITEYEIALRFAPDNAFYRSKLAIAYVVSSRVPDAIEQLEQAIELCPRDAFYRFELAEAYAEMLRHEDAVAEMEYAVSLSRADDYYHARLGMFYARAGQLNRAAVSYMQAFDLNPGMLAYLCLAADMYHSLGDEKRADSAYEDSRGMGAFDADFVHRARQYMLGGTW